MSVSVVIPTYQRRAGLAEVVRAAGTDACVTQIVVVIDGCDDGSYELAKELAETDPRIEPVWQENGGDAAARQTGVERAREDLVLLLDDDVVARPGLAQAHARIHAGVAGLVLLGYLPVEQPAVRGAGDFATLLYAEDYERMCRRYEADPDTVLTHLWMGNVSLRRADALRVGLVGPHRYGYHGDQDFGLRCRRAGLAGRFDRTLVAGHRHRRDLDSFVRQARLRGADRRYLRAHFPEVALDLTDRLPGPVRVAVALAAAPPLHRWATLALRAGLRFAGQAGAWDAQIALARLLRQVELRRGSALPAERSRSRVVARRARPALSASAQVPDEYVVDRLGRAEELLDGGA
jgi:glycosyltransferase involved in cell wall biosynthesis